VRLLPQPVRRRLAQWARKALELRPVDGGSRGWVILESFAGAFQQDVAIDRTDVSKNPTVFACQTLIANDIGKMRPRVLRLSTDGIWLEDAHQTLTALLRRPNAFQTAQLFLTAWILSLLRFGNCYVLLERDQRNAVIGMVVLDACRVEPLITPEGEVYYRCHMDDLAGILGPQVIVPATEIIHDRINCLFHPLIGVSPLWAANLPAQAGQNMARHIATFFGNMARPSIVLTSPHEISTATAAEVKAAWTSGFGGNNSGKVAVLGDDLKAQVLTMDAADAQLIETLKLSDERICSAFHVPPFMVGVKDAPAVANSALLVEHYYRTCLQTLIEGIENTLDLGLNLAPDVGIDLDVDALLRLDQKARFEVYDIAIKASVYAPNEARKRENLPPVEGGDSPMSQQQNFSLAALAKRDALPDPFAASAPKALPAPAPPPDPNQPSAADAAKAFEAELRRLLHVA
jgi:HK97 family phage portal protein